MYTSLIGIALDVSGSMQTSMQNNFGSSQSRYNNLHRVIAKIAVRITEQYRQRARRTNLEIPEPLVFVYAFGTSRDPEVVDLLSLSEVADRVITTDNINVSVYNNLRPYERLLWNVQDVAQSAADVLGSIGINVASTLLDRTRDSLRRFFGEAREKEVMEQVKNDLALLIRARLNSLGDTTFPLSALALSWTEEKAWFSYSQDMFFGRTPMRQCLGKVFRRFQSEMDKLDQNAEKMLIFISDGDPTDGEPDEELKNIKDLGVFVASCYITNSDITDQWRLYSTPCDNWPKTAKLMFEAASTITDANTYRELLESNDWQCEDNARVFLQINHSQMLENFLSALLGPE